MVSIGMDASSAGWAVAICGEGELRIGYYPTIFNLWHDIEGIESIAIDIPIGMLEVSRRPCDEQAKEILGSKQGSIFYTPPRRAVMQPTIQDAKASMRDSPHSVQNQAWGLVPRIREVDGFLELMDTDADTRIIETHPEVVFAALDKNAEELASKDTEGGRERRIELLSRYLPAPDGGFERASKQFLSEGNALSFAKPDDVIDAMAACVVAVHHKEIGTLPEDSNITDSVRNRTSTIAYYPEEVSLKS